MYLFVLCEGEPNIYTCMTCAICMLYDICIMLGLFWWQMANECVTQCQMCWHWCQMWCQIMICYDLTATGKSVCHHELWTDFCWPICCQNLHQRNAICHFTFAISVNLALVFLHAIARANTPCKECYLPATNEYSFLIARMYCRQSASDW